MIKIEFSAGGARTLIRVLGHVISQAEGSASSAYGIDTLCRNDSAARWRELRTHIEEEYEKQHKKQKAEVK